MDLNVLWQHVLEAVKKRGDFDLGLWRSLEAAQPLALEDGFLVVGFAPEASDLKPRLMEDFNRNLLNHIIRSLSPQLSDVNLRVIDGATPEAWEREKTMDVARRERVGREAPRQAVIEETNLTWEGLSEQLGLRFTQQRASRYPQTAARFLLECFPLLQDLEQQGGDPETVQRRLARVFNRLAGLTGIPAAQIALEYMRFGEPPGPERKRPPR